MKSAIYRAATAGALAALLGFATLSSGCAGPNTMEKAGKFVDDSVITAKVKAALAESADVSALDVEVNTYDGEVQLSGFVATKAEKRRAMQIANSVDGVRQLDNKISVRP